MQGDADNGTDADADGFFSKQDGKQSKNINKYANFRKRLGLEKTGCLGFVWLTSCLLFCVASVNLDFHLYCSSLQHFLVAVSQVFVINPRSGRQGRRSIQLTPL